MKPYQKLNSTNLYRDETLFLEFLKNLSDQKHLIVVRGLPGSSQSNIIDSLNDSMFLLDINKYLEKHNQNQRLAHQSMRRDLVKELKSKDKTPIVVMAPHVFIWELKYYRVQSFQCKCPFTIYESRPSLPENPEELEKLLTDININSLIGETYKILSQKNEKELWPSQRKLLKNLSLPNAVATLKQLKTTNPSFEKTELKNIQLCALLTSQMQPATNTIDSVWNALSEWEEITDDTSMWKSETPSWGW